MGAKPRGVGPRVGRAGIPVRVRGAPPSPPQQECGRAAAWQHRGPPPRREETAARLSRGSRASQAMTIFQPLAPAGQLSRYAPAPAPGDGHAVSTGGWPHGQRALGSPRGGLRVGWDREKSAHEATHRDYRGHGRIGLQRPCDRSAFPTAACRRCEPPVAGARAWGQPRVRAVQDAVAFFLRVHELGDILQAQPAHHSCTCSGPGHSRRGVGEQESAARAGRGRCPPGCPPCPAAGALSGCRRRPRSLEAPPSAPPRGLAHPR